MSQLFDSSTSRVQNRLDGHSFQAEKRYLKLTENKEGLIVQYSEAQNRLPYYEQRDLFSNPSHMTH